MLTSGIADPDGWMVQGVPGASAPGVSDGPRRAFVFDSRDALVQLVAATLNHGMFVVRAVRLLADAEPVLALWHPDIAIVDLDDDQSARLLGDLGASSTFETGRVPALGLVTRPGTAARLDAFRRGVDDVLAVPFSPDELLARATVITRRSPRSAKGVVPIIRRGDTEIDVTRAAVRRGRSLFLLSALEQRLLHSLAGSGGRVLSRDEILDTVWGADFVPESNVVDSHIRSLRRKLGDEFRHPRFIATVPGRGYRFMLLYSSDGWRPI